MNHLTIVFVVECNQIHPHSNVPNGCLFILNVHICVLNHKHKSHLHRLSSLSCVWVFSMDFVWLWTSRVINVQKFLDPKRIGRRTTCEVRGHLQK